MAWVSKMSLPFFLLLCCRNVLVDALLLDGDEPGSIDDRFSQLEAELAKLRTELEAQKHCTSDVCATHWSEWQPWTAWSHCSGQCSNGNTGRAQARDRQRSCLNDDVPDACAGNRTEVEHRPCNAVELIGCLNEQNTNTDDDTAYGLAYNIFDVMAQSTCTALSTGEVWVSAVRRDCYSGIAAECSTICEHLSGHTCIDSMHIVRDFTPLQPNLHAQTDEGKMGLRIKRYGYCDVNKGSCGPNYCCCKAPG